MKTKHLMSDDKSRRVGPGLYGIALGWLLLSGLFVGCRSVDPGAATQFSTAAGAAKQQAEIVFGSVNELAQSNIIVRAASEPALLDENFYQIIPEAQAKEWMKVFSILEDYGRNLGQLSSFRGDAELRDTLVGFGQQLENTADIEVEAGVLVGVAKLGAKLVEAKAHHDAYKVAAAVDSEVQAILNAMAMAIGENDQDSLRGTVRANINEAVLRPFDRAFLVARAASDETAKLELAKQYSRELENRRGIDQTLASLRRSIFDLGKAHQALAEGRKTDVLTFGKMIVDELSDAKDLFERLNEEKAAND